MKFDKNILSRIHFVVLFFSPIRQIVEKNFPAECFRQILLFHFFTQKIKVVIAQFKYNKSKLVLS